MDSKFKILYAMVAMFLQCVNISNVPIITRFFVHSEGNQTLSHPEGTRALGGHLGTWTLEGYSVTRALKALRHSSTYGTCALEALYLADSQISSLY